MRFERTPLDGAWVLEPERHEDERGHFARTFCRAEFEEHGLEPCVAQCSTSYNEHEHTLRGLHWQAPPHGEDKLVRCTSGAVFDVLVDLRRGSASYGSWWGVELSRVNGRQLYIPRGFAHGFLTLSPRTEVAYQMSVPFAPGAGAGLRWNDPDVSIEWPAEPAVLSVKDKELPTLDALDPLLLETAE